MGVTPSAGQVMVGGAAEVAPGVTPARGAASGAGEKSLFLGAREEGGCLAGRRCFRVRGVVSIAVVLKTLNWTFKC